MDGPKNTYLDDEVDNLVVAYHITKKHLEDIP